jgi:hypothetical protein
VTGVCRGAAIALRWWRGARLRLRGGVLLCAAVCAVQAHTPSDTSSFTVRGDGVTTLVASSAGTTAASVSATSATFTKTVVAVSTTKAAAANFFLFTVRAVAMGCRGVVRLRCAVRAWLLSEFRWLAGWLAVRLAVCVSGCLARRRAGRKAGRQACRLAGSLCVGLSGRQVVWLSVCQAYWLAACVSGCRAGSLFGYLSGRLAGLRRLARLLSGCSSLAAGGSCCDVSCLLCGCGLFRQGSSASVEKFSVRGDGLMTATTAEAGVSAVVAHATHATYAGSVLAAQAVRASDAGFYLIKVCAGLTPGC